MGAQVQQARQLTPTRAAGNTLSAGSPTARDCVEATPRYGDAAGAVLVVKDLTIQAGDRDLMTEVCWRVTAGQVWGLVGSNGCGKSTLLKCIAGQRPASDGTITVAQGTPVGCLEQTAVSGSTRTVWDEARSRMTVLLRAEAALEAAYAKLEAGDAQAAEQLADAQAAYEAAGGLDAEARIASVLKGLGFAPADFTRPASEFSGGWQMRIALARLLLSPAAQGSANGAAAGGLLLLDEPTNHLDRAAVKWLSSFLAQSPATVILVSHDEGLLEQACSHIIEVRGGAAHLYPCSYSKFLQDREQRGAQQAALRRKQQAEADRLEGFISRFGAKATKASQAKSVQKQLDKLKGAMVDAPVASAEAAPGDAQKVRLRLPPPPPCHREVLTLQDVATGWGEPRAGPPLLQGISLTVECGQRIVVLGKNGCGKSTLLRALAGTLPVWEGERRVGPGVEMGVFAQDLAQELPQDAAALDYVMDVARQADKLAHSERGRQSLGALGLSGSAALRAIGTMSGGEKARVALAAFALKPHNLLLLDEASNHLDVPTLQVLTAALQEFSGAVVAITHNPEFARALQPTHVLRVADGTARLSHCIEITPADFQQPSTPSAVDGKAAPSTAGSPNAATFKENDREARARLRKCQNRMKTLERLIEKAEPELERLQAAMLAAGDVNDVEELAALQAKIDTSELRIDEAFDEMEQLEAEIASLKATCHHAS